MDHCHCFASPFITFINLCLFYCAAEIGRLEVGSESGPDRSKSIKSFLTALLAQGGNTSVEGVDCLHGCYGATSALFNAVNWVESSSWDGRLAVVVASDMAIYKPDSPARPTGGQHSDCGRTQHSDSNLLMFSLIGSSLHDWQ